MSLQLGAWGPLLSACLSEKAEHQGARQGAKRVPLPGRGAEVQAGRRGRAPACLSLTEGFPRRTGQDCVPAPSHSLHSHSVPGPAPGLGEPSRPRADEDDRVPRKRKPGRARGHRCSCRSGGPLPAVPRGPGSIRGIAWEVTGDTRPTLSWYGAERADRFITGASKSAFIGPFSMPASSSPLMRTRYQHAFIHHALRAETPVLHAGSRLRSLTRLFSGPRVIAWITSWVRRPLSWTWWWGRPVICPRPARQTGVCISEQMALE